MSERYWRFRCKECGGSGWKYDAEGLWACFKGDHAQLSVAAKTCNLGDAWLVEQTQGVRGVER